MQKHYMQRNCNRYSCVMSQGHDLHLVCAGSVCCPSTSWTHAKVLGASEPAKLSYYIGQTAREKLWFLKQDKWRIFQAAEGNLTRNNLMELIKEKFQSNIVMLSSVSPGLVRLVQLCNNHPGKQMKFCHMKNGRIIWHITQMYTFWNSSTLAG